MFATAVVALALLSCSDDVSSGGGKSDGNLTPMSVNYAPKQVAKVAAYSNGIPVAYSQEPVLTIAGSSPLNNDQLESFAKVFLEILPEEQDNLYKTPQKAGVTDWTTNYVYVSDGKPFTLYPAYSQTASHDIIGIYYYDENGNKYEENIFDNEGKCPWGYYKNQQGIKITITKGYKFGFFLRTKYPYNRADRFGDYLGNIVETYYSNVSENSASCSKEAHYLLWEDTECHGKGVHSASFNYGGRTFFGFEDWEHFNSNFDLNDVVFMVDPALPIKDNPKDEDKKPEVEPTPAPTPDPTPDPAPSVVGGNGSVEVNFSINDRQYESNDTKLSIHVRDTTDVTIFIPTPADYYCPIDDMLIVQKHDVAQAYNTTSTVDMNIDGNIVSLTTVYSEKGITISTSGINAKVLKYLRGTYEDGLTFEITNYFATERLDANGNKVKVTREELQAMLNKATISFTKTPKFYINAFGVIDGAKAPNDCNVAPADPTLFNEKNGEDPMHGTTSFLYMWERK